VRTRSSAQILDQRENRYRHLRAIPRAAVAPCVRSQLAMRDETGARLRPFRRGASISHSGVASALSNGHTDVRRDRRPADHAAPAPIPASARKPLDGRLYGGHLRHAPSFSCHLSSFHVARQPPCVITQVKSGSRSSAFRGAHIAQPVGPFHKADASLKHRSDPSSSIS